MAEARKLMPDIGYVDSAYQAADGADALVIVTEWDAFRALDLGRIKRALKAPVVVDLRNIYRPEDMRRHGFRYISVGRPVVG
jgi:UDPglucose 6-dehydrogenase